MNSFTKLIILAKLLPKLGYINIFRVAKHRILLKFNLHPVCQLSAKIDEGYFFRKVRTTRKLLPSNAWKTSLKYFDWYEVPIPVDGVPNWFLKPFSGGADWPSDRPWWKTAALDDPIEGDIKEVWDLSRFNWLLAMAQRAAIGDDAELLRLNDWLQSWSISNPPYIGPNWGCGQEASIRVMHLAITAAILDQDTAPSQCVLSFVRAHLARIESTLSYALSQDNNHGILEAAGLFVGGEWLYAATKDVDARRWAKLGKKWLEERAGKLISRDGSFSMYSVSYHREFLDSLIICEYWRRRYGLENFSKAYMDRMYGASMWLKAHTNVHTGDAPNIGANDGTRLIPLVDTSHRDFRPSVQAACVLFAKKRAYPPGPWDLPLNWLGIKIPEDILVSDPSCVFNDSGFAVLRRAGGKGCEVFVRYPRFRFRPAHPDLMHLDLWINGFNVLPDSGTCSYNAKNQSGDYFSSTEAHNTIQFDGRNQMPRVGRFLLAEWPCDFNEASIKYGIDSTKISLEYEDYKGCKHKRSLLLTDSSLSVNDEIVGFLNKAVLRWRLARGDWKLECHQREVIVYCEDAFELKKIEIRVTTNVDIMRAEIKPGWESRRYFQKESVSVLEVEVRESAILVSEFKWIQ